MVKSFLFLLLAALPLAADVTLEGNIASSDAGQYRMLPFAVPAGTKRLTVDVTTDGPKGTYVYCGLYDPQTYRGAGRLAFTVAEYDATPPFAPGPILAGTWQLLVGFAQVPGPAKFTARIHFENANDAPTGLTLRKGPAWYQGDLHSHTGHSDGSCDSISGKNVPCPPFKLVEAAANRKLDFLAITDHNTATTLNSIRELQPYFDNILLVHGREMTTFNGHANVWGTAENLDYRIGFEGNTINSFLDQVHQTAALVSINHAYWPTGPQCPGCGWGWKGQTDFSKIDAIEAINGYRDEKHNPFKQPDANGIPFWEEQIAAGHRITAVGGGDDHRSGEQLGQNIGVGTPTTVVYADELSEPAILRAIKAGHVYIKVNGPAGPSLILRSGAALMGDTVSGSGPRAIEVETTGARDLNLVVLLDGKIWKSTPASDAAQRVSFTVPFDAGCHWVRVELRSQDGRTVALTNPRYINF